MKGVLKLRAPWERLAGCVWLARFTDKARLMRQGKLPPDYLMLLGHPRGIDGHFLRHFGLEKDVTIEALVSQAKDAGVEQWFLGQSGVTDARIADWNALAPNLGRRGWPGEAELRVALKRFYGDIPRAQPVETLFDLIRLDENLIPPPTRP